MQETQTKKTTELDKLYSVDAESAVLSCLLIEPQLIIDVELSPAYFSDYKRSNIFNAIVLNESRDTFPPPGLDRDEEILVAFLLQDVISGRVDTRKIVTYAEQVAAAKFARLAGRGWQSVGDLVGDDLADQLFEIDKGAGAWPEPPTKTKRGNTVTGTVLTIMPMAGEFVGKLVDRHDRKWRVCNREYYFRVKREAQKALEHLAQEPMFYLAGLDLVDVDRLINRWRMRSKRSGVNFVYQVYPYDEGLHAIVTNQNENDTAMVVVSERGSIPKDRTSLFHLLHRWLDTPEYKTLRRHSAGYGLRFEGMAGDGRLKYLEREINKTGDDDLAKGFFKFVDELKKTRKRLQLVTKIKRDFLIGELQASGYDVVKSRFTFTNLGKFANDLKKMCPDLITRHGNNAWFAMQEIGCTQLEDTEIREKPVCPSWVQGAQEAPKQPAAWRSPAEMAEAIPGF